MIEITNELKEKICKEYINSSIGSISKKYHISERRIKSLLLDNNILIKDSHKKTTSKDDYIELTKNRFQEKEGYKYIAISKIDGSKFLDYLNKSGALISHIKNNGIVVPSLFLRKKYFHDNGKQWYEQWFDIILEEDIKPLTKKCPYCNWETIDIENKSGMFMSHLKNDHSMPIEEYLKEHPEDKEYFKKQCKKIEKKELISKKENYVTCPICEEKLGNLVVSKNRYVSNYEMEITKFLTEHNIDFETNRQILIGKEIDILIHSKKIGIEFDGLKWHTEFFGKKNHSYHLNKTIECNKKGYKLIHIFEDEYVNHKDIVYSKLSHILGIENNKENAYGRKCTIKEIYKNDAMIFLEKFHIQGFSSSTVYIGAFYKNVLVGVMTFKNGNIKNTGWELSRFATNSEYNCCGVGGKLFKYFIKKYNPETVYSFADRRWTVDINENLYTKLGFVIENIGKPDYHYYSDATIETKYKRFHKMHFNKKKLNKKYGFPLTMTENEMTKELGFDRIWDCGLVKYKWFNF